MPRLASSSSSPRRFGGDRTNATSSRALAAPPPKPVASRDRHPELVHAASRGNDDEVRKLLALGVHPDAAKRDGEGALFAAASGGHAACARLLLRAGADPLAGRDGQGATALHVAARSGDVPFATVALDELARRDPAAPPAIMAAETHVGLTPIHVAAEEGHAELCALLAARGADLTRRDLAGRAPLESAVYWSRRDAVRELLRSGAKVTDEAFARADANGDANIEAALWRAVAEEAATRALDASRASPSFAPRRRRDAPPREARARASARVVAQTRDGRRREGHGARGGGGEGQGPGGRGRGAGCARRTRVGEGAREARGDEGSVALEPRRVAATKRGRTTPRRARTRPSRGAGARGGGGRAGEGAAEAEAAARATREAFEAERAALEAAVAAARVGHAAAAEVAREEMVRADGHRERLERGVEAGELLRRAAELLR